MTLAGGIVLAFFSGTLLAELLRHFSVAGFRSADAAGCVLLATLSFHGAAIAAGILFLKYHRIGWREAFGLNPGDGKRLVLMVVIALLVALPVMFGLKWLSAIALTRLGWPPDDQRAVEMILNAKSTVMKVYLVIFAVVIAPLAEEFVFRGLFFSAAKKMGWVKFGWLGVSALFALIHGSAAIFLPLFAFALVLTWLYEKTEGLFAPVLAHSLFNAVNVVLLFLAEHYSKNLPPNS